MKAQRRVLYCLQLFDSQNLLVLLRSLKQLHLSRMKLPEMSSMSRLLVREWSSLHSKSEPLGLSESEPSQLSSSLVLPLSCWSMPRLLFERLSLMLSLSSPHPASSSLSLRLAQLPSLSLPQLLHTQSHALPIGSATAEQELLQHAVLTDLQKR